MGDARRVDARRKGVARGGTKRWHGTFVPDVTGRRYYPFKLVIFGKYRFEKPITLFPHCAHSHPVEARASIYLRFHPLRAVGARGPGVLPEVKPTKVIPKTAQVMPLLSSGKKKKENIRGLPVEGNRNGQIDREKERESQVNHPSIFRRSNLWVSRVARFDVYRDIFEVMDDGWKREEELVGGAGRKRGSQFFEWRVPSLYWVYQIRDALAALTRNEVEGSKFLSLTANLSGWVFTSGLRVAWGTVFTVCCIPRKLELGLERAGRRISGRIIISGYIRFLKFSIIDIAKWMKLFLISPPIRKQIIIRFFHPNISLELLKSRSSSRETNLSKTCKESRD